jgi:hypothetical protein
MEVLCTIARDGVKAPQFVYFAWEIANFLLQFAAYGVKGLFTGINATSRYFQKKSVHGMAELADQKDVILFIKGHYSYTIAVLYHVSGGFFTAGFLYGVYTYVYRVPMINLLAG